MRKILFIDRDGTIIREPEDFQIDSFEKLDFEPFAASSLRALKSAGYELVMVSNQDGLGSDNYPMASFEGPHALMKRVLASEGVEFDEELICPHWPDDDCECRKPKVGLVKAYLADDTWDRSQSFVIGDRATDLQLATNMGIEGIRFDREANGWPTIVARLTRPARVGQVARKTRETDIRIEVKLDEKAPSQIATGIGFFDHMLDQIATHAGITLNVAATGDLHIDAHHTIEDVGIALGEALKMAIGDKRGLARFGFMLPMDECLAQCALDFSGRPYLVFDAQFRYQFVGDMPTEMVEHFFRSLAIACGMTLNLKTTGENDHHRVESLFKAFARALREAIRLQGNDLPSSKGML